MIDHRTTGDKHASRNEMRMRGMLAEAIEVVSQLEHGQDRKVLSHHLQSLLHALDAPQSRIWMLPLDEAALAWGTTVLGELESLSVSAASGEAATTNRQTRIQSPRWILFQGWPASSAEMAAMLSTIDGILLIDSGRSADWRIDPHLLRDIASVQQNMALTTLGVESSKFDEYPGTEISVTRIDDQPRSLFAWGNGIGTEQYIATVGRRLSADIELIATVVQEQLRKSETRRRVIQCRSGISLQREQEAAKSAMESLKRVWEDDFNALEHDFMQLMKDQSMPQSRVSNRMRNLRDDLNADDLLMEQAGRTLRLSVRDEFRQGAVRVIRQSLNEIVTESIDWLASRMQNDLQKTGQSISVGPLAQCEFRLPEWNSSEQIATLERHIDVEMRYNGEIPRKNWFDWLSQGRRPVFALTMIISIFGTALGLGSGRVGFLAPMMAVLFLTGMSWAVWEFRGERQRLLHRELSRFRDVVQRELSRSIDELIRNWQTNAMRTLRDVHKNWQRELSDWDRRQQTSRASQLERERASMQEQLKGIERQSRELGQFKSQLDRLQSSLHEMVQ